MEREQATKFIYDLLRALIARKGSDLFITAGFPPAMKIDGKLTVREITGKSSLTDELVRRLGAANVSAVDPSAPFVAAAAARRHITPAHIDRYPRPARSPKVQKTAARPWASVSTANERPVAAPSPSEPVSPIIRKTTGCAAAARPAASVSLTTSGAASAERIIPDWRSPASTEIRASPASGSKRTATC